MKRALLLLAVAVAASAQSRGRIPNYALVLEDAPLAQKAQSRLALRSSESQAHLQTIRNAQASVVAELQRRKIAVTGTTQVLVNAVMVAARPENVAGLRQIPGVKYVLPAPLAKPALDRAVALMNVPAAWSALGGASQAGAGVKIGIIDSGIDQNHPGFQDASLTPPAGFPKGDASYTNNKVIVARSYVQKDLAPGYAFDAQNPPSDPAAISQPDDYSARDRMGHGTAIAMIAAGVQNTGPAGTIQGVAPKAFLGNYKVYGSPGINDFTNFPAVQDALADALADGMDVVTLSMTEGDANVYYGPVDQLPECGGACDVYSMAVENAIAAGMMVVVAAGNDGNIGVRIPTLNTIHRPGVAPSAITVGALMNSHALYQSLQIGGTGVPSGLQSIHAVFGDGPHIGAPLSWPIVDVAQLGNDGLACAALPSGSLAGAIALVQRGTCFFSDKINNAANAGAAGVVIYQSAGLDDIYSALFAQNTGVPAMMIGNTDGTSLKKFLTSASGITATLDPGFAPVEAASGTVWPASSRGPSPGNFAATPTTGIKPEIAAVGVNIYTATQKFDSNGENYNASGYTSVTGTSFAVPMVAGAVALVKQKHPEFTPAQLKSAVVNTATQDVTDSGGVARVNSVGAGKLSAADALNTAATLEPATIAFGAISSTTVSITRVVKVTNTGAAAATFNMTVQQRDADSSASVQVSPGSLTLSPGQSNTVSVALRGNRPRAGSYEGAIVVSGGGSTLRLPYLYLVGDGIPADTFPILDGTFTGGQGDSAWQVRLRVIDQFGVPPPFPPGAPVNFQIAQGGGQFYVDPACFNGVDHSCKDLTTFTLGVSNAAFNFGPDPGPQVVTATVNGMKLEFDGYARIYPDIADGGVVNAATGQAGGGQTAGSRISILGPSLSDAWQTAPAGSLPVSLSDVSVSFDGSGLSLPGRIYSVSPGQVDAQVPWEFQGKTSVEVKVTISGLYGYTSTVSLVPYSPGIFETGGIAAAADASGAAISAGHPAQKGQQIQLLVNGLGAVSNTPATGEPAPDASSSTSAGPTVKIGGVNAAVVSSGLAAGKVGLYQITLTVPPDAPTGNQPVVVSIGGVDSKTSQIPVAAGAAAELAVPGHRRTAKASAGRVE
jgi:uncharacterized protein (TIGR03437 family)